MKCDTKLCVYIIRASRQVSTPSLTLASGMIEQVERTSVNEVDIDSMVAQWPPEGASIHQWPYDGAVSSPALSSPRKSASFTLSQSSVVPPDGLEQADIELKIGLSQYWPGCNSLLISVAPYWLMVNETDVDLFVIDGTSGQQWSLPHELTIAPPEFEVSFTAHNHYYNFYVVLISVVSLTTSIVGHTLI